MRKEENVGEGGWSTGKINLHSLCASHTVASSNGRADYLTAIVSRATDDQKYLSPGKQVLLSSSHMGSWLPTKVAALSQGRYANLAHVRNPRFKSYNFAFIHFFDRSNAARARRRKSEVARKGKKGRARWRSRKMVALFQGQYRNVAHDQNPRFKPYNFAFMNFSVRRPQKFLETIF